MIDWTITFHFVCFAWLFFRAPSLDAALQYLAGIWTDNGAASTMPGIVLPLIAVGAVTQILPPDFRATLGKALDDRGAVAQGACGFLSLYLILVRAPAASATSSSRPTVRSRF